MSYKAIICRIKTSKHPNADRLQLAEAAGYSCTVGIDHPDGELGILFPEGGQLSETFCTMNKLCRKDGGYLEDSRRVKALRLRGVNSEGLWLPLSTLVAWLGYMPDVCEGDEIDVISNLPLCQKYITPAVRRMMASQNQTERNKGRQFAALPRHYDTPQLRSSALQRPNAEGFHIVLTEKLHGTSGRTGRVPVEQEPRWYHKLINRVFGAAWRPKACIETVSGTRNTIINPDDASFRGKIHRMIAPALVEGEIWYYEIVGHDDNGRPIMPAHSTESLDKKERKRLGDKVHYHYGYVDTCAVFVYRIVINGREFTFPEIEERIRYFNSKCKNDVFWSCDVKTVPWLDYLPVGISDDHLKDWCNKHSSGPSLTRECPIMEGVCLRVEGDSFVSQWYKYKSFLFCCLEGIARNNEEYIDQEEIL
jgi:hypothetical protein